MNNTIKVWALGGVAAKVVSRLRKTVITSDGITPTLDYSYIDTSTSEVRYIPSSDELHLVTSKTGLSGSGGKTGRSFEVASEQVPGIVASEMETNVINFLIASTGGGSGSMLMYLVAKELLDKGEAVVCFITNTTDTVSRCHNAVTIMTSINNLAEEKNVVIPAFIYDTTDSPDFTTSDAIMIDDICVTAAMLSDTVVGLDDMDRRTALNPCLGGHEDSVEPGVKAVSLYEGVVYEPKAPVVSALTLIDPGSSDNIGTGASFIFSGVLSPEFKQLHLKDKTPNALSLLMSDNAVSNWVGETNRKYEKLLSNRSSTFRGDKIAVTSKAKTNNNGGFIS